MKISVMVIITAFILFGTGCGNKEAELGVFEQAERVELEETLSIRNTAMADSGFVALDWQKSELIHFDLKGGKTASYAREGNGPGEFIGRTSKLIGFYDGRIFLGDFQKNAVLIFSLSEDASVITYVDEFNIDDGRINDGTIDESGNIIVYTQFAETQLKKYDMNGNLKAAYLPVKEEDRKFSPQKLIDNMKRVMALGDDCMLISIMRYAMSFYHEADGEIQLVMTREPAKFWVKEPFKMDMTGGAFKMEGKPGIQNTFFYEGKLLINVLEDKEREYKKHHFQAYSLQGEYLGRYEYIFEDGDVIGTVIGVAGDGSILASKGQAEGLEQSLDSYYTLRLR